MDYYPAPLPLPPVPGYICQPSPTQTPAAVPPNIGFPTIVPAHDIAMIKQPPPCTLISNAYASGPMTVLHLPASLLQTLQRAPFQYDPTKDLVATCSQCGQKNTLWELRMNELIQCLKEEYALKCFLRKEIRFEPFPGEELQITVSGNMGYTQTDFCKISNLRANANEFTPAQRNSKIEVLTTNKYENHVADEYEVQQGQLEVIECEVSSGRESSLQDSGVSNSGNQNSTTMDSISEERLQNDSITNAHGSTESLIKKSNEVDDNAPECHVSKEKLMDSNRNYKYNDETAALTKKDKTMDKYNQMPPDSDQLQQINKIPVPGRPHTRGSDYKKVSTNGNERRYNGYAEDKRLHSRGSQGHIHSKTKTYDRSRRPNEFTDHGNDIHSAREQKYPFISRHSSNGNYLKKLVPRKAYDTSIIHEIEGDLFSADEDCSFAHCVSEDFRMGSGIASQFKKQFNGVGDLLNQQKTVGQIAYLERGGRFIFYLITKRLSYMKATLEVMQRALKNLRRLCEELKVKKLAMPLLGCGSERLRWDDVKKLLNEEFFKTDTEIFVYHCKEEEMVAANVESSPVSKSKSLKIFEVTYPLKDIDVDTAMVVYGCSDGTVEKVNEQLNAKYPYLEEFAKYCQAEGGLTDDFHAICTNREFVCVLIVRNDFSEGLSYTRLENSIRKLNKFLKENSYRYVGIDRINDNNDTLINDKIMSVFRSNLITTVNLYVCSSPPKKSEYQSSTSKSSSYYNTNSTVSSI